MQKLSSPGLEGVNVLQSLVTTNDAFKSSWEVHIYVLTCCNYDVRCVQVNLVGTRWRLNFSTYSIQVYLYSAFHDTIVAKQLYGNHVSTIYFVVAYQCLYLK